MDKALESLLSIKKYESLVTIFMNQEQKNEFLKQNKADLTEEERKRFSNVQMEDLIDEVGNKYRKLNPLITGVYLDGTIKFCDEDLKEYQVTMEDLGYILANGIYIKNN